jgi:hypothetical protein
MISPALYPLMRCAPAFHVFVPRFHGAVEVEQVDCVIDDAVDEQLRVAAVFEIAQRPGSQ